jgi:hypothetical protein
MLLSISESDSRFPARSDAPKTNAFVKVRAKHRKQTQFELPPIESGAGQASDLGGIAALRTKSLAPARKPARFVFRENEPLTLATGGEQ